MLVVASQPANLLWYLYGHLDPRAELQTKQEFLGEIPDYAQYEALSRLMMADSQQTAKAIGLQQAGRGQGVRRVGAEVTDLKTESPAQGILMKGDLILAVDGRSVSSSAELSEAMRGFAPGARIPLLVRRGTTELTLTVPTVEHPDRQGTAAFGIFIKDGLLFDLPLAVEIRSGMVTGPSAGLMFTLQIIDQLTPGGIASDLVVAGTGTIEADGRIGEIGGVTQKVYTAEAAGSQVIFVPQANYPAARQAATRIQVVPVDRLSDAVAWLAAQRQMAEHTSAAVWL